VVNRANLKQIVILNKKAVIVIVVVRFVTVKLVWTVSLENSHRVENEASQP
jgi:hypothetical protein